MSDHYTVHFYDPLHPEDAALAPETQHVEADGHEEAAKLAIANLADEMHFAAIVWVTLTESAFGAKRYLVTVVPAYHAQLVE